MVLPLKPLLTSPVLSMTEDSPADALVGFVEADRPIEMWAFDAHGNAFTPDNWFRISQSGAIQFTRAGVAASLRGSLPSTIHYPVVARDFGNTWGVPAVVTINFHPPALAFLDTYTGPNTEFVSQDNTGTTIHLADQGTFITDDQGSEGTLVLDGNGNVVQANVGQSEIFTHAIGPAFGFFAEVDFKLTPGVETSHETRLIISFYHDAPDLSTFTPPPPAIRFTFRDDFNHPLSISGVHTDGVDPDTPLSEFLETNLPVSLTDNVVYVFRVELDASIGQWRVFIDNTLLIVLPYIAPDGPLTIRSGLLIAELNDVGSSARVSRYHVDTMTTESDTEPPVIDPDQFFSYQEGSGEVVGQISASDNVGVVAWRFVDTGTTVSPDGFFGITSTGEVFLTNAGLDSAANNASVDPNTFTYSVQARDFSRNWSAPADISLEVTSAVVIPTFVFQVGILDLNPAFHSGYNALTTVRALYGQDLSDPPFTFNGTSHPVHLSIKSTYPNLQFADTLDLIVRHLTGGVVLTSDMTWTTMTLTMGNDSQRSFLKSDATITTVGDTLRFHWTPVAVPRFLVFNDVVSVVFE